jgi:hypothetical protein
MALKGRAYTKTSWAFQERPVTSAKLNAWDDNIEAALEVALNLLSLAWGGGDGVIRNAGDGDLAVSATVPASLSVRISPGYAFIARFPFKLADLFVTAPISAPSTNPRIDLVQACLETWEVSVKTGTEAASPTPPAADADCLALAQLYLRPGMGSIRDADDSTNGYIIDERSYV